MTEMIIRRFHRLELDRLTFPQHMPIQKSIFNEKNRRASVDVDYERRYLEFIDGNYFQFNGRDFKYVNGALDKVNSDYVVLDYNDGHTGYTDKIMNLEFNPKFQSLISNKYVYRSPSDTISFNIKTTISENRYTEMIYWDSILREFGDCQKFLVSGNNEVKRELCSRFSIPYTVGDTEIKNSSKEGGSIERGTAEDVIVDVQNCVNTNFKSTEKLMNQFRGIIPPKSIFHDGKAEKFDILVEYFKSHNSLV